MATKFTRDQMKAKIEGLLAKAESTDSMAEQQSLTEAAERLMLKMGIEAAELEARGEVGPKGAIEVYRDFKNIYAKPMMQFVFSVSLGYGNIEVIQSSMGGDAWRAYIIGIEDDVEQFLELLDSLTLQVQSALKRWIKDNREARRYETANDKWLGNRSFVLGYGREVKSRLATMRKEEEATASTGAALVLVDKSARIEVFKEQEFPDLRSSRGNRAGNMDGMLAGRLAGREARLGQDTPLPGARQALR